MPTYEYECQHCHQHIEAVQKFTDAPLSECPHCGGELRKVFSSVGIVFKGSGFYKNDSRTSAPGSQTKLDSPATSDTASVSSTSASSPAPTSASPSTSTSPATSSTSTSD